MIRDLQREIDGLAPWFHNLHLPDGVQTRPDHEFGDFPRVKWNAFQRDLPSRLDGWTALDVGCNAGFYTFELARRGAYVTAIDVEEHYLNQARWAATRYGLQDRIEFRRAQVYDLARTREKWDVVLFMGVFYHLRYPILALDVVCRRVGRILVFQSLSMPGTEGERPPEDMKLGDREVMAAPGWPKLAFIEQRLEGDPTNWWAPNHACSEALLRAMSMRVVRHPAHEIYICEPTGEIARGSYGDDNAEFDAILSQPARAGFRP